MVIEMDIAELIARVESTTGPDRELDLDLGTSLDGLTTRREFGMAGNWWTRVMCGGTTAELPAYTGSIDATVALIEKQLPGWMRAYGNINEHGHHWACLTDPDWPCLDYEASGPTEPLALLLAFLITLRDKEATDA